MVEKVVFTTLEDSLPDASSDEIPSDGVKLSGEGRSGAQIATGWFNFQHTAKCSGAADPDLITLP